MLIDNISTIVVEPGATAHVTAARDVRIELGEAAAGGGGAGLGTECDPIQLAIFSHRNGQPCCTLLQCWGPTFVCLCPAGVASRLRLKRLRPGAAPA